MKKSIEKVLGLRIAEIRKSRNIKQAQLAESINVATETISRIERGVSIPSVRTLERIGHALRAPLKDFLAFEPRSSTVRDEKEDELAKVMVLLQGKAVTDIRLGRQVLKSLFEQIKGYYRPVGR
ncbi:MAG: helix-turn-helix transcriptional regulator [Nitrospinae bacterium]|nr:helix-turn-helix transcriptional regulator [Nitrospinota bacterium]